MNLAFPAIRSSAPQLTIELAGAEIVLDRSGCAYLPAHRLLVVSDLHLEKGSSFARRQVFLPPYDSHETLNRLSAAVLAHDPASVICLGDSFHDREGHARLPEEIRQCLAGLARGRDWCWISGNHDPDAPEGLAGFSAIEIAIGRLIFRHEPEAGATGEVAGHLHPGVVLRRRGHSLRRPCFIADGGRMILPAFGAYTGSLSVRSRPFSGLFDGNRFQAYVLGEEAVYAIPGSAC